MSQLKRYNGSSWEVVGGNVAPKTTTTTSNTDTYSCNYVNDQFTGVNGDILDINSNISGLIKRSSVTVSGVSHASGNSVTATVPTGYVFLCWLTPASTGSVNSAYMEQYWEQTTKIWQTTSNSQNNTFICPYLMVKTEFLG